MSRFADCEESDGSDYADEDEEELVEGEGEDFGELEAGDGDNDEPRVVSLFDNAKTFATVGEALLFDGELGFGVAAWTGLGGMYDRIRVVNYIRSNVKSGTGPWTREPRATLAEMIEEVRNSEGLLPRKELWESEEFLMPVLYDDLYLTWCDDEHFEHDGDDGQYEDQFVVAVDDEAIVKEMTHMREELLERNHVELDELK